MNKWISRCLIAVVIVAFALSGYFLNSANAGSHEAGVIFYAHHFNTDNYITFEMAVEKYNLSYDDVEWLLTIIEEIVTRREEMINHYPNQCEFVDVTFDFSTSSASCYPCVVVAVYRSRIQLGGSDLVGCAFGVYMLTLRCRINCGAPDVIFFSNETWNNHKAGCGCDHSSRYF